MSVFMCSRAETRLKRFKFDILFLHGHNIVIGCFKEKLDERSERCVPSLPDHEELALLRMLSWLLYGGEVESMCLDVCVA